MLSPARHLISFLSCLSFFQWFKRRVHRSSFLRHVVSSMSFASALALTITITITLSHAAVVGAIKVVSVLQCVELF